MINRTPTNQELSVCAARIMAVTPRAPRTQVDTVAAEIVIMIGELCETFNQAQELTQHLVEHPQPRWNFPALKQQAIRFMTPAPPPPPQEPLQMAGFEIPEWVFKYSPRGAYRLEEFFQAVDAELWRRIQSWTPQRRQQLEAEVREYLAEYQRGNPNGPFAEPTAEQIKHYMIVQAGQQNKRARKEAGSLEPSPLAEHPPATQFNTVCTLDGISEKVYVPKQKKVRPKTKRP